MQTFPESIDKRVIGDREGDRLKNNLSPSQTSMNKGIQRVGDRLIEKMTFLSGEEYETYNKCRL